MRGINDETCDAAVEYLHSCGEEAATAFANRQLAEFYRKAKRAALILRSPEKSLGLREAWAESHEEYLDSCRAEAEAVRVVEWHRHQMTRAKAVLEVWRSINARERELSRVR